MQMHCTGPQRPVADHFPEQMRGMRMVGRDQGMLTCSPNCPVCCSASSPEPVPLLLGIAGVSWAVRARLVTAALPPSASVAVSVSIRAFCSASARPGALLADRVPTFFVLRGWRGSSDLRLGATLRERS